MKDWFSRGVLGVELVHLALGDLSIMFSGLPSWRAWSRAISPFHAPASYLSTPSLSMATGAMAAVCMATSLPVSSKRSGWKPSMEASLLPGGLHHDFRSDELVVDDVDLLADLPICSTRRPATVTLPSFSDEIVSRCRLVAHSEIGDRFTELDEVGVVGLSVSQQTATAPW